VQPHRASSRVTRKGPLAATSNAVNASPPLSVNDATSNSLDNRRPSIRDASNDVYCARCDLTTVPHDVTIAKYEDTRALATALGMRRIPTAESLRKAKLRDIQGFFPIAHEVNANAETNDPCKWVAYWTWKLGGPDPRPRYRYIELTSSAHVLRRAPVSDADLANLEVEVKKLQVRLATKRTLTSERDRLAEEIERTWAVAQEIGNRINCGQETGSDFKMIDELLASSKRATRYLAQMAAVLDPDHAKRTPSPKQRTTNLAAELLEKIRNYRIDRETIVRILTAHGAFEAVV